MNLEEIAGQVNRDQASTTSHPRKIKAFDITSKLVFVNNHGGKRRRRREKAAIYNENINIFRLKPGFTEERIHGREDHKLGFSSCSFHCWLRGDIMNCRRQTRLFSKPRPLQYSHLELNTLRLIL
uniref:3-ketoacyl-CoA synthase n=1 Tax=Rhizophora mucronata TaxID=61149 RepID=A0A2P2Q392_RHIMU